MSDETETHDEATGDGSDELTSPASSPSSTCPACGSPNSSAREICRDCGTDLETGAELPWPVPDPSPDAGTLHRDTAPHPRRWWLAIAAILTAAGLVVLGLVVAEVGPFAPPTPVPSASFDPSLYADDPEDLLFSDVATVTTQPPQDGRSFEAAKMVDDDDQTAWRSEGQLDREGEDDPLEIVDLFLEEPAWISTIVVRNGDQVDAGAYEDSSRIRRVRAAVDGGTTYLLNLLDDGRGRQAVELPEPVLTSVLRLEIVEVFPGANGDEIAVSDLAIIGWVATGDDVTLAEERAEVAPATGQSL